MGTRTAREGPPAGAAGGLFLTMSGNAGAADTVPTGRLPWDRARAGAPSYQKIRDAFGVANFHQSSQLRLRLHATLRGECQRGVERVLLVVRDPAGRPERVLAAR